jgi:hypothetical protein
MSFIKEYIVARGKAFLLETIKKAWVKCGIYPLNPNIFTDNDFTPSTSTSTGSPLPASYPAKVFSWQIDAGDGNFPEHDHNDDDSNENDHDDSEYNEDEFNYDDDNDTTNSTENDNNTHAPVQSERSSQCTASITIRTPPPPPPPPPTSSPPSISSVFTKWKQLDLEAENADLR